MKFIELELPGVFLIENFFHQDERGVFVKTYNEEGFIKNAIKDTQFKEIYYSVSQKDSIRGMHFQLPTAKHAKLIYLTNGRVTDVVLDLRKNSNAYGRYIDIELEAYRDSIYIPRVCAHGFKALENSTIMVYNQTSVYNKDLDSGLLYNSFGFNWGIDKPIISERYLSFEDFSQFISPFQ